ncbi:MAG TPA: hypothetical protein VFM54_07345 [Micromonosporaceae bacterium]|nr:hypothetical protein [Micromonosporaceae bacterium]
MTEDIPAHGASAEAIRKAFGERNRARLLTEYFSGAGGVATGNAWKHVYRLLLSIDRTIGLVHCYEGDKCQPGKPWYPRSLMVHGWIADQFGTSPMDLAKEIDWLFRRASVDLASLAVVASRTHRVVEQRRPFQDLGFPEPGEHPELTAVIFDTISEWLHSEPPRAVQRELTERILAYVNQENKRKNLIGEGFEDTIAAILCHIPGLADSYDVYTRRLLHDVPGFARGRANEKPRKVDLVLVRKSDCRRILVTAKWSVRADREEQFMSDFRDYSQLETLGTDFDYVLITNEFDAARLVRACERRRENAPLFTDVVHVQPTAPALAYRDVKPNSKQKAHVMRLHMATGRLSSLEGWIRRLTSSVS